MSLALVVAVCLGINLLAPPIAAETVAPLHNSDRFACSLPEFLTAATCTANGGSWNPSRKWQGGWGISGEKYGAIQCGTCHTRKPDNGNIKLLRPSLTAPDESFFPVGTGAVVAQEAVADISSDFGDDADAHTSSARICEVCHSRTRFHRFDTSEQLAAGGNLGHFNRNDCITCHRHKAGFRPLCSDCHGNSVSGESWPDGLANNTLPEYADADDSGSHSAHVVALGGNASCASCHPLPDSGSSHLNGSIEVGGPAFTFTRASQTCGNIVCHGTSDARWGQSGCLGCHGVVQGARVAVGGQFAANSHHIQGVQVADTHCYVCHWEAKSNGTIEPAYHGGSKSSGAAVDLVVYGSGVRPGTYALGTTALVYHADGSHAEIEKLNDHCLGCHRESNDTTVPFADGKTPKQYAWDGKSVDSRYSQSGTTLLGKYTDVAGAAQKLQTKAYSAHGNAPGNQGGWSEGPAGTGVDGALPNIWDGAVKVACYDCHNSHGSSISGRTTSYTSPTVNGGLLKETSLGIGGYAVNYKPVAGGSAEEKNLRNPGASLCFDCHLQAAGGPQWPWGYQTTFGAARQILGYNDALFFGSAGAGLEQRFPYKGATLDKGGHFGASATLKTPPMKTIDGLCTPCHDPHGVSPTLGANQPYGVPLLKGTWLSSLYKEDVAPEYNTTQTGRSNLSYHIDQNTFRGTVDDDGSGISETASQFAGLCLQCHPKSSLTDGVTHTWQSKDRIHESVKGWKTANGTIKHNYPCSKCHTPHSGATLPRLMITNCLDWPHKGRVATQAAVASISGSGSGGGGRLPGAYSYYDPWSGSGTVAASCHEGNNGTWTDQRWNGVTSWENAEPTLSLTPPVTQNFAKSYLTGKVAATIAWTSNIPSDSVVDFGATSSYGRSASNLQFSTAHAIGLYDLDNHSSYHFQVLSKTYHGQLATSSDQSFSISVPPSSPTFINELDNVCAGGCSVNVAWNAATDPDSGVVEYAAEVDDDPTFASPVASSAWSTTTSAALGPLAPGKTWYWHVRARDAAHVEATSSWSSADTFQTLASLPPPTPIMRANVSNCIGTCPVTVSWSAVTTIDTVGGGVVEYFAEVDDDPTFASPNANSGWVSGTNATVSAAVGPLATNTTWYWHVKARYSGGSVVESVWSSSDHFDTIYPLPAAPSQLTAPAATICAGGCTVPLQWYPATGYLNAPVKYYVEVDDVATFASPNVSSGWIDTPSWTVPALPTSTTWYWRVRACDAVYDKSVTAWTTAFFRTMTVAPPPPPVLVPQGNYDSGCAATDVTVQWNPVASPDGHAVEYYVQADGVGDSGWLPIGTTSWTMSVPGGYGVSWKVMARDAVHTDAISSWSDYGYFYDVGSTCWSSSCPLVFSGTENGYAYTTDMQGPIIGLPPSNIKKDTALYQPTVAVLDVLQPDAAGSYRVKLWESLPEISYVDAATLLAVEYPTGYEIHTSAAGNTYNYGYVEPFKIYTAKDALLPLAATDSQGRDVLAALRTVDNQPAPLEVIAPDNYYTVDFGTLAQPQYAKLLIDGWSIYGVKKFASDVTIQPYVEVVDAHGNWVKVKAFGTPAGDLKSMVVDLANLFLSNDHRVRIHLGIRRGSRWVIDRLRLDQSAPVEVGIVAWQPAAADLQRGGIAIQAMSTLESRIIAADVALPLNPVTPSHGNFTRYGDVTPLLTGSDDKFVIMREGDKIDLVFNPSGAPRPGFTRSYLFKTDLYYKTLTTSDQVEPLPFHGMSDYPYTATESYPQDADHLLYLQQFNTRSD